MIMQFKIKNWFLLTCCLLSAAWLQGQYVPVPASAQPEPMLIKGATVHVGNGETIESGWVAFDDGKITYVGTEEGWKSEKAYREIEAKGQHLYPGFIAANTQLGLEEIGAVRASRDDREIGGYNPHVRALIAYNTDSEIIPTIRSNGILLAQVRPDGGLISGQSSVMQLDAWNWQDAAFEADNGIFMGWPRKFRFNWRTRMLEKSEGYKENLRELEAFLLTAKAYAEREEPENENLILEAMRGLFDGSQKLFVEVNGANDMQEAVLLAEEHGLDIVLVGGRDAWMITDFLKEKEVPVILSKTHRLPARPETDIDQPFKTPAILQEAGVNFCISHDGSWQVRNLAFQAGHSVSFGLPYEEAVRSLTLSPATILGIADRVGSIEEGKDATLFLSVGDALDMRTQQLTHAFIQGRTIDLDNKHEMLYRKFKQRYNR